MTDVLSEYHVWHEATWEAPPSPYWAGKDWIVANPHHAIIEASSDTDAIRRWADMRDAEWWDRYSGLRLRIGVKLGSVSIPHETRLERGDNGKMSNENNQ